MNKKTSGLLLAGILLLGLSSCSDENPWMGEIGHGAIRLNVSADSNVKKGTPSTKADDGSLFEIPDAADFSIHLTHSDGTFREFETLEHFKSVESFKTGTYTLRAFYGKLEDQGFNRPYFEGIETVNVLEGRTAEVSVRAKVMNSLVSVTYTDEFKNYLSGYSTTIQSEGYEPVKFVGDESQPAFVAPGEVTVTVSFTNPQGQSVTLQPSSFTAKAGVHHVLKYNVNGTTADDMQLEILLDDALEEEEVLIDLTEELFTSPAPTVNAKGFEAGDDIEFLAGSEADGKYRFNVVSYGGLRGVTMTLASNNGFSPEFGSPIELMQATEAQQAQLKALGFDIKGLYKNPDKMAYVDFTEVLSHLKAGEYTLTLQAKDMLTRSSEPVSVNLLAVEPTLEVNPLGALAGINVGTLEVEYNGTKPLEDLSFEVMNAEGMYVKAAIKEALELTATRSLETHKYYISLDLPDTDHSPLPVKVYLYGELKVNTQLEVSEPQFSLEADAFAHKTWIKVKADIESYTPLITSNLKLFVSGGGDYKITNRNPEEGLIMLEGLTPSQLYRVQGSLLGKVGEDSPEVSFTTETPQTIPDVATAGATFNYNNIDAGGVYYYFFALGSDRNNTRYNYMQNTSSISFTEPAGWTTVNQKTCYPGSTYENSNAEQVKSQNTTDHKGMNTWYCVPSTFLSGDGVLLRSVAHDPHGKEIPLDDHGMNVKTKYSANAPSEFAYHSAGELFLGEYDFDGDNEKRVPGINFSSRPSSLTFEYTYTPINNTEVGYAEIKVYDASGVEIASGQKDLTSGSGSATVELKGYNFGKKAAKIYVGFRSTKGTEISAPVPSSFVDVNNSTSLSGLTIATNEYKSKCVGSELKLTNVKLTY